MDITSNKQNWRVTTLWLCSCQMSQMIIELPAIGTIQIYCIISCMVYVLFPSFCLVWMTNFWCNEPSPKMSQYPQLCSKISGRARSTSPAENKKCSWAMFHLAQKWAEKCWNPMKSHEIPVHLVAVTCFIPIDVGSRWFLWFLEARGDWSLSQSRAALPPRLSRRANGAVADRGMFCFFWSEKMVSTSKNMKVSIGKLFINLDTWWIFYKW